MALIDVATLAKDAAFRDRLTAALIGGALDALLAATPPGPRLAALASSALHQREDLADRFAWGVAERLAPTTTSGTPTDAQIRQALATVWTAYAGPEGGVP